MDKTPLSFYRAAFINFYREAFITKYLSTFIAKHLSRSIYQLLSRSIYHFIAKHLSTFIAKHLSRSIMNTLQEIFASLKHNKLRTTLTGLAVAWGIFIFIVLLGAGNGLRNGVMSNFGSRANNSAIVWTGTTSRPYDGMKSGRRLYLTDKEMDIIKKMPETTEITGVIWNDLTITYKNEYGSYSIVGIQPTYKSIENIKIAEGGRFINDLDEMQQKKVVVLDKRICDALFKNENGIGKYVKIGSIMFRVVGINTQQSNWGSGNAYIPFSTAQVIYNPDKKLYQTEFILQGLETLEDNEKFTDRINRALAKSLRADPEDPSAFWIWNRQQQYIQTQKVFGAINLFVGIIGIFTLIAGIVGISNIMLVSVKERTREFGIRKAVGAPPASILWSVVLEAVIITAIFGYIGLICGVGLTEGANWLMSQSAGADNGMTVFKNPTIGLNYAFAATALMIVAGVIAGYIPARKAVRIKPIEAMREQ
jgi:putative ABC transport system permease protein